MDTTKRELALQLAGQGMTLAQISTRTGVSVQTLGRAGVKTHGYAHGRRAYKKDKHLAQVVALHNEGLTVHTIADEVPVHWQTIAEWLKAEGLAPRYDRETRVAKVRPDITEHPKYQQVLDMHAAGHAEHAISTALDVSRHQVRQIVTAAGVADNGGRAARAASKSERACDLYRQQKSLDEIQKTIRLDYYRLRLALHDATLLEYPDSERPPDACPCGQRTGVPGRKYCSPEHVREYGEKKQADPARQVTFNCQGCGKEVTRYRSYGNGSHKYCSNECSAKHNRTKQHIVIEDALVLDSPFEALFYGLCRLWKIEIVRADRAEAIPFGEKGWYCPDFYLPDLRLYVEVKGFEDDDDRARCDEWRKSRQLAVLRREELHVLRTRANDGVVREQLKTWSYEQAS